jgi:hypothetical protein
MPRAPGNTRGRKWKGPPGLTPKEKAAWSERQRWKHRSAAQRRAANAKRRTRWKRRANLINDGRRERRFRFAHRFRVEKGYAIITLMDLRRPPLRYIDAQGRIWQEDFRSAHQLIADWKAEQRKKGHHP